MTSESKGNALLPPYSLPDNIDTLHFDGDSKTQPPPAYSSGSAPTKALSKEFRYEIDHLSDGKPIAVLTILGHTKFSRNLATIVRGQPLKGKVTLDLEKSESFKIITVQVQGKIVTGTLQGAEFEEVVFLDLKQTLWSREMGLPGSSSTDAAKQHKSTSEIPKGDYSWDFSIDIPAVVTLPYGPHKESKTFELPETFSERTVRPNVLYQIIVVFEKQALWERDDRVIGPFAYIPISTPPPFPPLRLLAYEGRTPLPGPKDDPEGWHAMKPIVVKGELFKTKAVEIGCTLFLAKPLSYTRGSVVPLSIQLQSSDPQALDLLTATSGSASSPIVVQLQRRVHCQLGHDSGEPNTWGLFAWRDNVSVRLQPASWWSAASDPSGGSEKWLNGELHLRGDTATSTLIAPFRVQYSVGLFPFNLAGFEMVDSGLKDDGDDTPKALGEQIIEIVSAYAPGPRPVMVTPAPVEKDEPRGPPTLDDFFGTAMNFF